MQIQIRRQVDGEESGIGRTMMLGGYGDLPERKERVSSIERAVASVSIVPGL